MAKAERGGGGGDKKVRGFCIDGRNYIGSMICISIIWYLLEEVYPLLFSLVSLDEFN